MFDEIFTSINKLMPDFKARPQQVEMSRFIHQRLQQSQNRMAVVEAPTGVGKTLAYLSGAIETALNSKKIAGY